MSWWTIENNLVQLFAESNLIMDIEHKDLYGITFEEFGKKWKEDNKNN